MFNVLAAAVPLDMSTTLQGITDSFSSSLDSVVSEGVAMVAALLPAGILLAGTGIVVTLGFKYAKRFTSKA